MERCETCRYWGEDGFCERVELTSHGETTHQTKAHIWLHANVPPLGHDWEWFDRDADNWGLKTAPNFGCVQWAAKEEDV